MLFRQKSDQSGDSYLFGANFKVFKKCKIINPHFEAHIYEQNRGAEADVPPSFYRLAKQRGETFKKYIQRGGTWRVLLLVDHVRPFHLDRTRAFAISVPAIFSKVDRQYLTWYFSPCIKLVNIGTWYQDGFVGVERNHSFGLKQSSNDMKSYTQETFLMELFLRCLNG